VIPLPLSPALLAKLRANRARRNLDEVEREHDAFLLDPGLGPAVYLTSEGRLLADNTAFFGDTIEELTKDEDVIPYLVVGARKTGVVELLELVPPAPADAVVCPMCEGSRYWQVIRMVCLLCRGRSWATRAMIDAFGPIPQPPDP